MTKTICFFNADMSRRGGTERITQILSSVLNKEKKYKIIVLSLNNETKTCYYPLDEHIQHYVLNQKASNNSSLLKNIYKLYKFVKKRKVNILINVDVMLGIFSLPLKILTKIKLIGWEQFNYYDDIGTSKSRIIRQLSLLVCDYYINLTKSDMEIFKQKFKIKCPITFCYNPIADGVVNYTGYNKDSKTIITAGHFFYTKGYDLAVEVAKLVLTKHPDWKWEFYGDGVEFESIKQKILEYNLNIILCGRKRNLIDYYRNSSIYVMTSRMEGFGLVLLEAQSNNLPIVAFNVPFGPKEIIENNVNGFLIEPFDISNMADKINYLIENTELRLEFSKNAKVNIDKFSIEATKRKWCEILDSL